MKTGFRHAADNIAFMVKECRSASPSFLFVCIGIHALRLIAPLTGALGIKLLLDSLSGGAGFGRVVWIAAAYCGLNTAKGFADSWYENSYLPAASLKISKYLDLKLMRHVVSLDMAVFDDAAFFDKYMRAKNEITNRAVAVVTTLAEIIGCVISLSALTAVIVFIEPFVLVYVCAGVALSFGIDLIRSKLWYRYDLETTPINRRIDYIRRIFYEPQYMTELRLFRIRELSELKYASYADKLGSMLKRQGKVKTAVTDISAFLESGLFNGTALIYLGWRVCSGAISIGDFSAMFSAVFSFGTELYSFVDKFPELYRHSLYIDNLRCVLDQQENLERGGTLELDPTALHRIEFRNVSFAYANGVRVLDHINMVVEKGQKAAVVGYNGAGKSTLVKLMCRLYDPDEGEIFIDGVNLREYRTASLRAAFGIVMQSFHSYAFTIAENICPICPEQHRDKIAVAAAASDLSERLSVLQDGLESQLTREFDAGGVVLSGGEFQKLSLARAILGNPSTLILDEATSALDPVAEERLNETLLKNAQNKSVIFISHRLGIAREADVIFMFEHGRIVESGSHAALMNRHGQYARLYMSQARYYSA